MSAFTPKTRELVLARDAHTCQWCGRHCYPGDYSLQHRRARGMGGSKNPLARSAGNAVTMCGSGTTGCHGYAEQHRTESASRGFTVAQWQNPHDIPIRDFNGTWWLLREDGGRDETTEPREEEDVG